VARLVHKAKYRARRPAFGAPIGGAWRAFLPQQKSLNEDVGITKRTSLPLEANPLCRRASSIRGPID
jgi:hypothetical protein